MRRDLTHFTSIWSGNPRRIISRWEPSRSHPGSIHLLLPDRSVPFQILPGIHLSVLFKKNIIQMNSLEKQNVILSNLDYKNATWCWQWAHVVTAIVPCLYYLWISCCNCSLGPDLSLYFPSYEWLSSLNFGLVWISVQWQTDRQTESDAWEPTVQFVQVGSKMFNK